MRFEVARRYVDDEAFAGPSSDFLKLRRQKFDMPVGKKWGLRIQLKK
jgi:hypothetical protein